MQVGQYREIDAWYTGCRCNSACTGRLYWRFTDGAACPLWVTFASCSTRPKLHLRRTAGLQEKRPLPGDGYCLLHSMASAKQRCPSPFPAQAHATAFVSGRVHLKRCTWTVRWLAGWPPFKFHDVQYLYAWKLHGTGTG